MLLCNLISVTDGRLVDIGTSGRYITSVNPSSDRNPVQGPSPFISFQDAIVFPGLINSHDHLDFNSFPQLGNKIYPSYVAWGEDIHLQNKAEIEAVLKIPKALRIQWGVYKNLLNGITTVVNHGPKTNIETDLVSVYEDCHVLHSVQLDKKWKLKLNFPFAKKQPFVIHVGEGTDEEANKEIDRLIRWNILNRKLIGIHAVAMTGQQARHFKALIWCPDSNYFLVGDTAPVKDLKQQTRILFGTDSTVSAGWNLWNHLRLARQENQLTDAELYASLTTVASEIWRLPKRGSITTGQEADLVVAERKTGYSAMDAFYSVNPEEILLVTRQGRINLVDARLENAVFTAPGSRTGFSAICINGRTKYVRGDLPALMKEMKRVHPGVVFPFYTERTGEEGHAPSV